MGAARSLICIALDAVQAVLVSHGFSIFDLLDFRQEHRWWRMHSNGTVQIVNLVTKGVGNVPFYATEETAETFHTSHTSQDDGDGYTYVRYENSDRVLVFRNENRLPWNT